MSAIIIDGTAIAKQVLAEQKMIAGQLTARGQTPGLAVLLVGDDGLLHLGASHAVAAPDAPPGWTEADLAVALQKSQTVFPMPLAGTGTAGKAAPPWPSF